jgi:hypothetical protein
MSTAAITTPKFFGLLELNEAGTVLYARAEPDGGQQSQVLDATGRNFYTEIAPFENVVELREQLDHFNGSAKQCDSIRFTCQYADGPQPVKILFARIRERGAREVTKSILVHIRRAE